MRTLCVVLLCASLCSAMSRPRHRVRIDHRMFKPSTELEIQQNQIIDQYGLERVKDDRQLAALVEAGVLVPLVNSGSIVICDKLPRNRRYVRPWVNEYLLDLSTKWQRWFPGVPLVVTSAVRTEKVQRSLLHWNRNAAPVHGERASSHLAGTTVDIARRNFTREQRQTLEVLLRGYRERRQAIIFEENGQACFHLFWIPKETA